MLRPQHYRSQRAFFISNCSFPFHWYCVYYLFRYSTPTLVCVNVSSVWEVPCIKRLGRHHGR
jgi:hypothetical protein